MYGLAEVLVRLGRGRSRDNVFPRAGYFVFTTLWCMLCIAGVGKVLIAEIYVPKRIRLSLVVDCSRKQCLLRHSWDFFVSVRGRNGMIYDEQTGSCQYRPRTYGQKLLFSLQKLCSVYKMATDLISAALVYTIFVLLVCYTVYR